MKREDQDWLFAAIGFFLVYAVGIGLAILAAEGIKWWPIGIPVEVGAIVLLFSYVWRKP